MFTQRSAVFVGRLPHRDAALTRAPQALAPGARPTAVSWTGGKDCNLALLIAWRDPTLRVTSLVVFRPEDAAFRAHPLELAEMQAGAIKIRRISRVFSSINQLFRRFPTFFYILLILFLKM